MAVEACSTCKFCIVPAGASATPTAGNMKCAVVVDPVTGTPMPLPQARYDTYQGYTLPCGYAGAKWEGKDGS